MRTIRLTVAASSAAHPDPADHVKDASVTAWLLREAPKHLRLLSRLRRQCEESLTVREGEPDADGRPTYVQPDLNDSGTPTRDWCRAFARYQHGFDTLIVEQREREAAARQMSEAELAASVRKAFLDAAGTFSEEEWGLLDAVRFKKQGVLNG